jgi:hypothetical protein
MNVFRTVLAGIGFGAQPERTTASVKVYRDASRICVTTVAKTTAGFFLEVEPITVLAPNDLDGLAAALSSRMVAPLRHVATPPREQTAALLRHTPYRRWTELERKMATWSIEPTPIGWKVIRYRRRASGKGLEPEDDGQLELDGPPATVAASMAELLIGPDGSKT